MSCPIERKKKEIKLVFKLKNYETIEEFESRIEKNDSKVDISSTKKDFNKDKTEKKIVTYSKEAILKNEIKLSLIKAYVRYCIGKKRLESEGN